MNLNELTQKLIDIESVTGNENEVIKFDQLNIDLSYVNTNTIKDFKLQ